jgi:hypothetical protein
MHVFVFHPLGFFFGGGRMEGRGNAVMSVLIGEHSHLLMIYLKKIKKFTKKMHLICRKINN